MPEPTTVKKDAVNDVDATKQADPQDSAEKTQYPVSAPPPKENESKEDKTVREMVAQDLQSWQEKIATQAKKGATENEERTNAIARRFIEEKVNVDGRQLIEKLNATVQSELADVKLKVASIAKHPSEGAQDQAIATIRSAGLAIKGEAQAIRKWHEEYLIELQKAVLDAADEFFVILTETQSLALQKIGMKWAWIDGITYRDWAKYHELRATLSQWTDELKGLITGHPTLLEAQGASAQIEEDAMEIASVAAKELARLKEVAGWKIVAADWTDNFDSDAMRLAAEAAQETGRAKASVTETGEETLSRTEGMAEEGTSTANVPPSAVAGSASEAASSLSEAVVGSTSDPSQAPPRPDADGTVLLGASRPQDLDGHLDGPLTDSRNPARCYLIRGGRRYDLGCRKGPRHRWRRVGEFGRRGENCRRGARRKWQASRTRRNVRCRCCGGGFCRRSHLGPKPRPRQVRERYCRSPSSIHWRFVGGVGAVFECAVCSFCTNVRHAKACS